MFRVNERKRLRKKSEKGYKEIIDLVCLEALNKRHELLELDGEVSSQGPRRTLSRAPGWLRSLRVCLRTVSRGWRDPLREREGSFSSECPCERSASPSLTLLVV